MLDVTSWKILMLNKYNHEYKKKNAHRALDDILESIEELKFYTSFIK
jgi:oligoribonuclease